MRAAPSTAYEAVVQGFPPSLVGTVGVRVIDLAGGTVTPRQTTGIIENVAGSGDYAATLPGIGTIGHYLLLWDSGGALSPSNVAVEDLFISNAPVDGITVTPGGTFKTSVTGSSGITTLGVRLVDNQGATIVARDATAITEFPAGSGVYQKTMTVPPGTAVGQYESVWDTDTGSPIFGSEDVWVVPASTPVSADTGERIPPTLMLCGDEVINPARALTYLKLYNPLGRFHDIDTAGLPSILYRLRGAAETFSTPAVDNAPWYDPAVPSSSEFLGVLIDAQTGLDGRSTRSLTPQREGVVLGRTTRGPVQVTMQGWVIAMSYAGLEYGKRWLVDALNQSCDDCDVCDAQIRLCAPPDNATDDELCHWLLPDVALTSGPDYGNMPCAVLDSVKFTLTSQSAWLYRKPVACLAAEQLWSTNVSTGPCIDFSEWFCGTGGPQHSCTIEPPRVGVMGAIVTIDAVEAVGNVRIGRYTVCPPDPAAPPESEMIVDELPSGSRLVIDSSRRRISYTGPDGQTSDGTPYIIPPDDGLPIWFEFDDCSPTSCISVQVAHACGGGVFATVQIDKQLRQE